MADEPNLLYALKLKLRRKYASDLPGLKTLSDEVFAKATQTVTITSLSAEGESSAGEITCSRSTLLQAIEEVILELDDTAPRPSSTGVAYFR